MPDRSRFRWLIALAPLSAVGCERLVPVAPSQVIVIERAATQPAMTFAPSTTAPAAVPQPVVRRRPTIEAFDLLEISVGDTDRPEPPSVDQVRVQADGTVRLPIVGRVTVADLTRSAAEVAVADAFKGRQIYAKPAVRLYRKQSAGEPGVPTGPVHTGDLVQVVVHDLTANGTVTTVRRRVDETGRIDVPLIDPINVAGLTDPQIAEAVVLAYADKQIVAHANVSVVTLEAAPDGVGVLDLPDAPVYLPAAFNEGPTTRPAAAQ